MKHKEHLSIVKIGGHVIDNEEKLFEFLQSFSCIDGHKILVHGGGKISSAIGEKMGVQAKMHEGRRMTDKASLDISTMVYAGLLNKRIVSNLQSMSCNAIGLSGADANAIVAKKREVKTIDFGWVGDVTKVNSKTISKIIDIGLIPVFNAIVHNEKGQLLNVNADTIAAELAVGLSELYDIELMYLFEKDGVLADVKQNVLIESIDKATFQELKDNQTITEGMIPKLDNCFYALNHGVKQVKIAGEDYLSNKDKVCTQILC